jgi:hypothetical protein
LEEKKKKKKERKPSGGLGQILLGSEAKKWATMEGGNCFAF